MIDHFKDQAAAVNWRIIGNGVRTVMCLQFLVIFLFPWEIKFFWLSFFYLFKDTMARDSWQSVFNQCPLQYLT